MIMSILEELQEVIDQNVGTLWWMVKWLWMSISRIVIVCNKFLVIRKLFFENPTHNKGKAVVALSLHSVEMMFYLRKHTGGDRSEVISVLSHIPRHHSRP
jgi:hypothetical protein